MPKLPTMQTTYSDYLYRRVDDWFTFRGRAFTIQELAEFADLKVTGNMRRRLQHCVVAGTLNCQIVPNYNGKRATLFYRPQKEKLSL